MPYNPSSAYPRHSTYVPPVYGRAYARGFNEVPWGTRYGGGTSAPQPDIHRAIQKGLTPGTGEHIGMGLTAMARRGIISNALATQNQRNAATREKASAAGRGPGADNVSNIADRPQMDTMMESRGGRKHLAGVNERLGAIYQREETSSAMDEAVEGVLNGTAGGPMKAPKFRFSSLRRKGP